MKLLSPVLVFCALALPNTSFGQAFELWVGGGTSNLGNKGIGTLDTSSAGRPDDVQLKGGFRINFRMALNSGTWYGHELGYAYNRTQLVQLGSADQGMAIHQGFYNFLVYPTKEGARIRPFATGGVHFSNFVPPGSSAGQGGGNTKFGVNYGAGIKVRLTSMFGLRLDFRQYLTPKPFGLPQANGWLRQNEISAGFGWLI